MTETPRSGSLPGRRAGGFAVPAGSKTRAQVRRRVVDALVYLLLGAGAVAVILPFAYMVASSLETIAQIGSLTPQFWPDPLQWSNYAHVWQGLPIARYFVNSLIVAVGGTRRPSPHPAAGGRAVRRAALNERFPPFCPHLRVVFMA